MSGFNGRRGPNVSQYIASLNTDQSDLDLSIPGDLGDLQNDLDLFTNPDFFVDFDANAVGAFDAPSDPVQYDPAQEERARRQNAQAHFRHGKNTQPFPQDKPAGFKATEFVPTTDFNFPDYTGVSNALPDHSQTGLQQTHQQHGYPMQPYAPVAQQQSPVHNGQVASNKRKIDSLPLQQPITPQASPQIIEEASRVAAEEDKRRRNTAASARFRVKKKQREQALERTAKEMSEKCNVLESKVGQLEMENKWLKSLLTEKHEGKGDISELKKVIAGKSESKDVRSTDEHTTGVGTSDEE